MWPIGDRRLFLFFVSIIVLFQGILLNADTCPVLSQHRQALYARIHPSSVRQLLLFAALYPDSEEGKAALQKAWSILSGTQCEETPHLPPNFEQTAISLISLIEPSAFQNIRIPEIDTETLTLMEHIGERLPTRKLLGHNARTLEDIERLAPSDIDIARALLILQEQPQDKILVVEAALDLLALEVLSKIGSAADPLTKISALNTLLFHDLGIRFPPEEEAAIKTAQFSELSSVLFSRRGVCLGASVLFMSLAQRIELPLSIYTPPGHIFVAYRTPDFTRVIETTARGIDLPLDAYLGLTLKSLSERSLKEVVGMVAFNSAAGFLKSKEWEKAHSMYQKALRFEQGYEITQMISLCELILNHKPVSQKLAQKQVSNLPPERLENDLLLIDLSKGALTPAAAQTILECSDAKGDEISHAIAQIQEAMKQAPKSQTLPLHLAYCWLSYGKPKEAIPLLEQLAAMPEATCTIHAMLAMLYEERHNHPQAWAEAKKAAFLAKQRGFIPVQLREFILFLHQQSPNSQDLMLIL